MRERERERGRLSSYVFVKGLVCVREGESK